MSFSINARAVRGVNVVDLSGRMTIGEPVLLLRDAVRRCSEDGNCKFVLNLEDISYIDSCGLGELVATYTSACNRGGNVNLLNPSKRTMELLELTRLSEVFDIFNDENTAVQSMSSDSTTNP